MSRTLSAISLRRLDGVLPRDSPLVTRLVEVFREARRGRLQFTLDLHDAEQDRLYFCDVMLPKNQVWIAEAGERVVGFIAFAQGWVNHLYVAPAFQGRGIGSELLAIAQRSAPSLLLWAFQVNAPAIEFYLRRGFQVVERTDGAANEARQPDVRMEWKIPGNPAALTRPSSEV